MKSIVIVGPEQFEIRETDVPKPQKDEFLIRLIGNTMCNQHDAAVFAGTHSSDYPLETGFPGHEGVGEVMGTGADTEGFSKGDLVVMSGIGGPPLYSEYVTRKQGTCFKVEPQEEYDIQSLACLELYGCVFHALEKADTFVNKKVGVAGLGAAGLAAVQLLSDRNPSEVTGIDINKDRFDRARSCGADSVLDASQFKEFSELVKQAVKASASGERMPSASKGVMPDRQFDIIVECSGNALSTAASFCLAKEEVIMFGFCRDLIPLFQHVWFETELTIKNSRQLFNNDLEKVADLTTHSKIDPAQLITHRFTFEQYAEAIESVKQGKVIKGILSWQQ
jgi:L-gulonate 5-dehydrogenase